jgi:hypothetical protein
MTRRVIGAVLIALMAIGGRDQRPPGGVRTWVGDH